MSNEQLTKFLVAIWEILKGPAFENGGDASLPESFVRSAVLAEVESMARTNSTARKVMALQAEDRQNLLDIAFPVREYKLDDE